MSDRSSWGKIGDYVELQRGNTYKSALLGLDGPVLLGLASIARNGGFRGDNLKTYGGASDPRILLRPGDIYVSLKDVTQSADLLGAVARVPVAIKAGRLTQDTVKLVFKDRAAPTSYVYWLLRTPQYRAYCKAHSTGTTNLGLAREDFFAFPVPPLISARAALVELLQALEDKIDLNRRTNETLEAIARAIYKDWFVDFGPTRAKIGGHLPYLAPDFWALFPPSFNKDGVPPNWNLKQWGEIASLEYGKALRTHASNQGRVPVYGTNGRIGWHEEPIYDRPSTIIGRKGAYRGVHFASGPFFVIDTAFYLKLNPEFSTRWGYYSIDRIDINGMDSGSAIPSTSRDEFYRLKVVVPPPAIHRAFEEHLQPLWALQEQNDQESVTLAATRDFLLPKLMSGEIRVREAEKFAEAAA